MWLFIIAMQGNGFPKIGVPSLLAIPYLCGTSCELRPIHEVYDEPLWDDPVLYLKENYVGIRGIWIADVSPSVSNRGAE